MIELLKREDDCVSLGRLTALCSWVLWVLATVGLLITGHEWAHYETLTTAAFGSLLIQVANKAVECKFFKVGETHERN